MERTKTDQLCQQLQNTGYAYINKYKHMSRDIKQCDAKKRDNCIII